MALCKVWVALPDASIYGANMRRKDYEERFHVAFVAKAPTVVMTPPRLWAHRSPRACVAQWKRIYADCARFDEKVRVVSAYEWTGAPADEDLVSLATAMYNGLAGMAQGYDVLRNPRYNVGAPFLYMEPYRFLSTKSDFLRPRDTFTNTKTGSAGTKLLDDEHATSSTPSYKPTMPSVPEGSPGDAMARVDDAVQSRAVLQRQGLADSTVRASASKDRRRPVGTKIAKKQRLERLSADGEAQSFHSNEDG